MKKVFGIQAEINITADEEVTKGLGHGIRNGTVILTDVIKELRPTIIEGIKKAVVSEDVKRGTTSK